MQIHLLIDSPFYTDRIIEKIRRFEPQSRVFVTIKSHKVVKVREEEGEREMTLIELQRWIRSQSFTSVYVHFLSNSIAYVLHKTQLTRLPCHWILWGADFYGLPSISHKYYLPLSRPYAWKNNSWRHKIARFLGLPSSKYVYRVLEKMNYFIGYEEEYKLTQMTLGHKMEFIPWEYYFSIEELNLPKINRGQGAILLGNSDDPMNNHLDVLEKLEKVVVVGQRIIIPIAGASDAYLQKIKEVRINSKADIIIQDKLMDSQSFFDMLQEVSYVVFGHLRQQGVGTLLPLLYQGKKAFLWNQNPFKATLERWGISVNAIDDLKKDDFKKLTEDQVERHRSTMDQVMSTEADNIRWERILKDK